jgi:hypothetical protein
LLRSNVETTMEEGKGESMHWGTFLFLVDGRVFVRRDGGEITEATPSERRSATRALAYAGSVAPTPTLGVEIVPPRDS